MDCVHVLSKQNVRKKENDKKTLQDPPSGMECGRCVAHLLFIILLQSDFYEWSCLLILKNDHKRLIKLAWRRGMKKREREVLWMAKSLKNRQQFFLFFLRPAKNQQANDW